MKEVQVPTRFGHDAVSPPLILLEYSLRKICSLDLSDMEVPNQANKNLAGNLKLCPKTTLGFRRTVIPVSKMRCAHLEVPTVVIPALTNPATLINS